MKCKYCCADDDSAKSGYRSWECGTYISGDGSKSLRQSQDCKNGELARYRKIFPSIMPDDPREITAEICESLWLANEHDEWWTDSLPDGTSVRISDRGVWVNGEGYGLKAGQLACLIAARKAST